MEIIESIYKTIKLKQNEKVKVMYVCVCMYVYVCVCMYVCTCICMYVCMYVCMCVSIYLSIYLRI